MGNQTQPELECPACGARYRVPAEFAGRTVACRKCRHRFKVLTATAPTGELTTSAGPLRAAAAAHPPAEPSSSAVIAGRTTQPTQRHEFAQEPPPQRLIIPSGPAGASDVKTANVSPAVPLLLGAVSALACAALFVRRGQSSSNPNAAFALIGVGAAGYALLVVPLAGRAMRSTSVAAAAIGVATLVVILTFFQGGVGVGGVALASGAGLALVMASGSYLHRREGAAAVRAGVGAAAAWLIGGALTAVLVWATAVVLAQGGQLMPWQPRPTEAAGNPPAPSHSPQQAPPIFATAPPPAPRADPTTRRATTSDTSGPSVAPVVAAVPPAVSPSSATTAPSRGHAGSGLFDIPDDGDDVVPATPAPTTAPLPRVRRR